jgi:cytochrome P450
MGLPPGSRLPAAAQTAAAVHDPVTFFRRNRDRFGPVFRARFVGVPHIAYVATPALADLVLRTDRDIGRAGAARKDFLEPLVGAQSVLCLEGEPWMRERHRLAPAFRQQRMRGWADTIAQIVEGEVATWPLGTPFALRPRMQRVTLEVIWRVVFGFDDAGSDEEHDRLRLMLPELLDVASSRVLAFVPPRAADWLADSTLAQRFAHNPLHRFYQLKQSVDAVLTDQSRRRRQSTGGGQDVLSMLVSIPEMTEAQIRDEVITLLTAGHETTSTGLSWLFERLVRLPEALASVLDAVATGDDVYLDAVVKESLRVRPVVLDAPRALAGPIELAGHEIPSGWYVAPVLPLVHTDPATYDHPDAFRPERFLGDHLPPGAWIPFGGSRRLCLGIHLAMLEMRVVLSEVLRRVSLTAVDAAPERPRLRGVTIVPSNQTRVVAKRVSVVA